MQDIADLPVPSGVRPVLYGAGVGVAAIAIFFVAYLVAPNLALPGTFLIALGLGAVLLLGLNLLPARAAEEIGALARGEAPPDDPTPADAEIAQREARVAALRTETDAIDRAGRPAEWIERVRALADETKLLAATEMGVADRRRRRASLAHHRQAAGIYRRIVGARGQNRSSRDWATAQIALGECLLVLGEAEGARDEVLEAVNAFTAALETPDLDAEERAAGDNGLLQAEGVLASMADRAERNNRLDDADLF